MSFACFRDDVDASRLLVWILEIQVSGNEVILHHEDGINQFAGSCHPHFMSRLSFGRSYRYFVISKDLGDS